MAEKDFTLQTTGGPSAFSNKDGVTCFMAPGGQHVTHNPDLGFVRITDAKGSEGLLVRNVPAVNNALRYPTDGSEQVAGQVSAAAPYTNPVVQAVLEVLEKPLAWIPFFPQHAMNTNGSTAAVGKAMRGIGISCHNAAGASITPVLSIETALNLTKPLHR